MTLLDPTKALYRAIEQILRPLFRLFVRKGIGYPAFAELAKKLYVEAAYLEEQKKNSKITDSRLSTLTGIHRKEIKRLRAQLDQPPLPSERKAGLAAQLVSQWLGRDEYALENGTPRPIPYTSNDESAPSFTHLVQSITRDVHPRTLLDTWLEQGLLTMEGELILLNQAGYVPDQSWEEALFFAGKNLGAHSATVVENLLKESPPQLDRAVYYYRLSPQSANQLEHWARQEALKMLTAFNHMASQLQQQDSAQEASTCGIHFGAYLHRQTPDDPASETETS